MSDAQDTDRAVKDPVCGKLVDPLRARAVGIYGGVTRYFCSAECKAKYADPRQDEGPPPEGVERRHRDDQTGDWFTQGAAQESEHLKPAPSVERFVNLEHHAPPPKPVPPSPSLLIEVAATKKRGHAWLWVIVVVAVVVAISVLGLRR